MCTNLKKMMLAALVGISFLSSCSKNEVAGDGGSAGTPPASNVTITTIAGKLNDHGNTEDGNGANARFWNPGKMVFDNRNNTLYVADGTTIRSIDAFNNVNTYLPLGTISNFNEILDIDLAPGVAGTLFFTSKENDLIKVEPNGGSVTITKLIDRVTGGNATGPLNAADELDGATGVATGSNGDLYFFNAYWNTLRHVGFSGPTTGMVDAFAGKPLDSRSGTAWPFNDGWGDAASFGGSVPDITSDANGNVYVADFRNGLVRKVTPDGLVSSLFQYENGFGIDQDGSVSVAQANRVTQVAVTPDGNSVFFTTYGRGGNNLPALRMVKPGISVSTLVGGNLYGDGAGNVAGISTVGGIAATPDGKIIYLSEPGNKLIRKVVIN